MLDPASAIGLTASIVQISSFIASILNASHEIHNSASSALTSHVDLESICTRLNGLLDSLVINEGTNNDTFHDQPILGIHGPFSLAYESSNLIASRDQPMGGGDEINSQGRTEPSETQSQLAELSLATKAITQQTLKLLDKLKHRDGSGKWQSLRQAIRSLASTHELKTLEHRLDQHRSQIHSALLSRCVEHLEKPKLELTNQVTISATRLLEALQTYGQGAQLEYTSRPVVIEPRASNEERSFVPELLRSAAVLDNPTSIRDSARVIVESLSYDDMPDRHAAISPAYQKTFEWIFDDNNPFNIHSEPKGTTSQVTMKQPDNCDPFINWLKDSQRLYWITGKPGAGKSTLMKYLYQDQRTTRLARYWASTLDHTSGEPITLSTAAFFFWISGTRAQRSLTGLYRTLLYQLLKDDCELAAQVFSQHIQHCRLLQRRPHELQDSVLILALEAILAQKNKAFLLFIDGLDEFGGHLPEVISLVQRVISSDHVKLCISSRPWNIFEEAFEDAPLLRIEYLTRKDILTYVTGKFNASKRFTELRRFNAHGADALMIQITEKASGVFLWVHVVVERLLKGIRDGDDVDILQQRLQELPPELEALFDRILNQVDPDYVKEASGIFQFVRAYPAESTLLGVFLSSTPWDKALTLSVSPYPDGQAQHYANTMKRRLYSRCKCFLEVDEPYIPKTKIRYLHRTAKDFLEEPGRWSTITAKNPSYEPHRAVSISRLLQAKITNLNQDLGLQEWLNTTVERLIFDKATESIEPLEQRIAFLDNVDSTAAEYYSQHQMSSRLQTDAGTSSTGSHWSGRIKPRIRSVPSGLSSMFELAMFAGLQWYALAKLLNHPELLFSKINENYPLIFAVKKQAWSVQQLLLDHGADPNHREGSYSAWNMLLHQAISLTRQSCTLEERKNMMQTMTQYLKHGAETKACSGWLNSPRNGVKLAEIMGMVISVYKTQDNCHEDLQALTKAYEAAIARGKRRRWKLP